MKTFSKAILGSLLLAGAAVATAVPAEARVGLGNHLEGPAEPVEVVHVERAKIYLHGLEQILQGHAFGFGLGAVNLGVELRDVDGERGEKAAETGCLIPFAHEAFGCLKERVVTEVRAVFDEELKSADGSQPHDRRRRHGEHEGILDGGKFLVQRGANGRSAQLFGAPFFERL